VVSGVSTFFLDDNNRLSCGHRDLHHL
jgi:hypothetical protein